VCLCASEENSFQPSGKGTGKTATNHGRVPATAAAPHRAIGAGHQLHIAPAPEHGWPALPALPSPPRVQQTLQPVQALYARWFPATLRDVPGRLRRQAVAQECDAEDCRLQRVHHQGARGDYLGSH